MIKYIPRYSHTDEPDEKGRWARVAYFKDKIQIAWISLVTFVDKQGENQAFYSVSCKFPTLCNDTANNHYTGETFEDAREWLEKEWSNFLEIVKNK